MLPPGRLITSLTTEFIHRNVNFKGAEMLYFHNCSIPSTSLHKITKFSINIKIFFKKIYQNNEWNTLRFWTKIIFSVNSTFLLELQEDKQRYDHLHNSQQYFLLLAALNLIYIYIYIYIHTHTHTHTHNQNTVKWGTLFLT